MSDDIVIRLEEQMDFVEYLRLWASPDSNNQAVRDLHKAADEIESLRKERDRYWATTNDAISERNYWIRLFMLAFDSHFDKTWDGETADLLGQAYDEAECICGDDKL